MDYNNIKQSIVEFCKPEKLDGNNKYYCDKCKNKNDSIKQLQFDKCKIYYF